MCVITWLCYSIKSCLTNTIYERYWADVRSRWLDIVHFFSFFIAILWTETKLRRSIKIQKRTRSISSHLDQTRLVHKKFILSRKKRTFSCITNSGNPKWDRSDWPILPVRLANQNTGFASFCSLTDSSI